MNARLVGLLKNGKQRLTYLGIVLALSALLKVGHATQWNLFPSAEGGVPTATTAGAGASTTFPPSQPTDLVVDDELAAKAGIRLARVEVRPIAETVNVSGVTVYDQDHVANLSVRTSGHVWRVEKRVGEQIRKGDCLAIVDAVEVGEAKTEYLQAFVNMQLKDQTLARLTQVKGEVAEKALRQAEAEAREARLRMLSAEQRLINLGLPADRRNLSHGDDERLARDVRVLGLPKSVVDSFDAQTTTANLLPLTAPFDGVVIGRAAAIGEVVSPNDPQFIVADIRRMWVMLDVRKESASLVRHGQRIEFVADGTARPVLGKIDWISTEVNPATRTLQVRATVENPPIAGDASEGRHRLLKANTFGTGSIVIREMMETVCVPRSALHTERDEAFVFIRDGDRFRRRDVRTGVAQDGHIEILSGLKPGDTVAADGSHVLKATSASAPRG